MVVAERENIAPGLNSTLTERLKPGDVRHHLRPPLEPARQAHRRRDRRVRGGEDGTRDARLHRAAVGVPGLSEPPRRASSSPPPPPSPNAIAAGDLDGAREAWLAARQPWRQMAPVSGRIGDLANRMDPLADYLAKREEDPGFTGFHRIEYGLWAQNSTEGLAPVAAQLAADAAYAQGPAADARRRAGRPRRQRRRPRRARRRPGHRVAGALQPRRPRRVLRRPRRHRQVGAPRRPAGQRRPTPPPRRRSPRRSRPRARRSTASRRTAPSRPRTGRRRRPHEDRRGLRRRGHRGGGVQPGDRARVAMAGPFPTTRRGLLAGAAALAATPALRRHGAERSVTDAPVADTTQRGRPGLALRHATRPASSRRARRTAWSPPSMSSPPTPSALERLFRRLTERIVLLTHGGPLPEADPKLPPPDSGILGPVVAARRADDHRRRSAPRSSRTAPGSPQLKPRVLQRMTKFHNDALNADTLPRRPRAAVLRQHPGHGGPRAARHREEPARPAGAEVGAGRQRAGAPAASRCPPESARNFLGFRDGSANPDSSRRAR